MHQGGLTMPHQKTKWIVNSDTNTCHIYSYHNNDKTLNLVKTILHPECRLTDVELTTDRLGRYKARDIASGAYVPHSDPKEVKIQQFAQEIARYIDHGRTTNEFQELIIVALPHMNGALLKHLSEHVKQLISNNIEKNIIKYNDNQILDFLKTHTIKQHCSPIVPVK